MRLSATTAWTESRDSFVTKALELCGLTRPKLSQSNGRKAIRFAEARGWPERLLTFDATMAPWTLSSDVLAVEILSDSQIVTKWLLGTAHVSDSYSQRVGTIQTALQKLWQNGCVRSRLPWVDNIRHIFREMNGAADAAAKQAVSGQAPFCTRHAAWEKLSRARPRYLQIFSDGSRRSGIAGAGWVAYGAWEHDVCHVPSIPTEFGNVCGTLGGGCQELVMPKWEPLVTAGVYLANSTVVNAELSGIEAAVSFVQSLVSECFNDIDA